MKRRFWIGCIALTALILAAVLWLSGLGVSKMERLEGRIRNEVSRAAEEEGSAEYVCPVDFESLRAVNSDVYGWLYIKGTEVSGPLLQRQGDSAYYASHNSAGKEDPNGALFTDSAYSGLDLQDPATVVYGKSTGLKSPLGALQTTFSSGSALEQYGEIIIYLPEEEARYTVFAALPYGNYDLPYYFNFGNEERFQAFLDSVNSVRTLDTRWNRDVEVSARDQLLILSTTRSGNTNQSYLVLAKRTSR